MEKRLNIDLPDEIHKAVKMKAVSKGKTLKEIVLKLIINWLKKG